MKFTLKFQGAWQKAVNLCSITGGVDMFRMARIEDPYLCVSDFDNEVEFVGQNITIEIPLEEAAKYNFFKSDNNYTVSVPSNFIGEHFYNLKYNVDKKKFEYVRNNKDIYLCWVKAGSLPVWEHIKIR